MDKRIEWVDAFRGFGIVCVIFFHSLDTTTKLFSYISWFIMPLFFFIAGFLFEKGRYKSYVDFALRKIWTRIVPYAFFVLITYVVYRFAESRVVGAGFVELLLDRKHYLLDAFMWGTADHLGHIGNIPLWFLPCLFVTENYFYCISKMASLRNIGLTLIPIALAAFVERTFVSTLLPWGIDTALTETVFYGSGFIIKELMSQHVIKLPRNTLHFMTLALLLMASSVFFWVLDGEIHTSIDRPGRYAFFLAYVCPLSGIMAYALLSMKLVGIRWLRFLGQNSLILYVMNNYMLNFNAFLIAPFLDSFVGPLLPHEIVSVMDAMYFFPLWNSGTIILLTIPFIYLINRAFPFLIGRRYTRKRVLMVTSP